MGDKTSTFELEDRTQVLIRSASSGDAERIAILCQLLGYPASLQSVQERLKLLEEKQERVLYIAHLPDEPVVGWIHVYVWESLLSGRRAEIDGLIVHADYRGRGVGHLLMRHAEQWAQQQGCGTILVRSNVVRQEAHHFYEKVGYIPLKTQLVLHKVLSDLSGLRPPE